MSYISVTTETEFRQK